MSRHARARWAAWIALAVLAAPTIAQVQTPPEIKRAIDRGRAMIHKDLATNAGVQVGEAGLGVLALLVTAPDSQKKTQLEDPVIQAQLKRFQAMIVNGLFTPQRSGGPDNYEAGIVLMVFAEADSAEYFPEIKAVTDFILKKQSPDGSWGYSVGGQGDTSMTHYACLGLWQAANASVEIPIETWDKALYWLMRTQDQTGGFTYHPSLPAEGEKFPKTQNDIRHSMSVAAAGCLIICQKHLPYTQKKTRTIDEELLVPIVEIEKTKYVPVCTKEMTDEAIRRAQNWMESHFTIDQAVPNQYLMYYIYGLERYAALLGASGTKKTQIGKIDWYSAGSRYLLSKQLASGGWLHHDHTLVDTGWALLFLGRSTEKKITQRIKTLNSGTLFGGRGVPTDDGPPPAVARRMRRYRPELDSPIGELLKILESTEEDEAQLEKAINTIEKIDPEKLVKSLGGNTLKLQRFALDQKQPPPVRRGCLTALANTKRLTVVPILIEALGDPEQEVYAAARDGLRLIARNLDAFGLPEKKPEPAELAEGVEKWKTWFESLQIKVDAEQDFTGTGSN